MRAEKVEMAITSRALAGKRVLIVEDEMLVALLLEDFLIEFGCTPMGPCGSVAEALKAVGEDAFDLAVLDVNLGGERVYPVADALTERHIPFLFVSGYGEEAIPDGREEWKVCAKPFRADVLATMLSAVLDAALTDPHARRPQE